MNINWADMHLVRSAALELRKRFRLGMAKLSQIIYTRLHYKSMFILLFLFIFAKDFRKKDFRVGAAIEPNGISFLLYHN